MSSKRVQELVARLSDECVKEGSQGPSRYDWVDWTEAEEIIAAAFDQHARDLWAESVELMKDRDRLHQLVADLKVVVDEFGEFDPDLDETCCPTNFVECRCCGGSGQVSGRGKKKPPKHTEDCAWKRLIDGVKDPPEATEDRPRSRPLPESRGDM